MQEKMKKVGILMSIYMGITMSLCLSVIGNLTGSKGGFILPLFLITLAVSLIISLLIGFLVPMGKISRGIHEKVHGPAGALVDAFVSDLIYTPVITLAMVTLVRRVLPVLVSMGAMRSAMAGGASEEAAKQAGAEAVAAVLSSFPPFPVMFFGSFVICMIAGFVLILIFQPLYMKLAMKQCGINGMPAGPNGPGGPKGPGGPNPPQE